MWDRTADMRTACLAACIIVLTATVGCTSSISSSEHDEVTRTKQQARTDAKQRAEELADRVGTNPQIYENSEYNLLDLMSAGLVSTA